MTLSTKYGTTHTSCTGSQDDDDVFQVNEKRTSIEVVPKKNGSKMPFFVALISLIVIGVGISFVSTNKVSIEHNISSLFRKNSLISDSAGSDSLCIKDTCIYEDHLKMLTGEKTIFLDTSANDGSVKFAIATPIPSGNPGTDCAKSCGFLEYTERGPYNDSLVFKMDLSLNPGDYQCVTFQSVIAVQNTSVAEGKMRLSMSYDDANTDIVGNDIQVFFSNGAAIGASNSKYSFGKSLIATWKSKEIVDQYENDYCADFGHYNPSK